MAKIIGTRWGSPPSGKKVCPNWGMALLWGRKEGLGWGWEKVRTLIGMALLVGRRRGFSFLFLPACMLCFCFFPLSQCLLSPPDKPLLTSEEKGERNIFRPTAVHFPAFYFFSVFLPISLTNSSGGRGRRGGENIRAAARCFGGGAKNKRGKCGRKEIQ